MLTRDEVKRLAEEAGIDYAWGEELERFASLVEARSQAVRSEGQSPSVVGEVQSRLAGSVGLLCFVRRSAEEVEACIAHAANYASPADSRSRMVMNTTWGPGAFWACLQANPDVIVFPAMADESHANVVIQAVRSGHLCITGSTNERLARVVAEHRDVRRVATVVAD